MTAKQRCRGVFGEGQDRVRALTTAIDEVKGTVHSPHLCPGFVQDQLADDLRLDIQEPQIHIHTFEKAVKRGFVVIPEAKISAPPHPFVEVFYLSSKKVAKTIGLCKQIVLQQERVS